MSTQSTTPHRVVTGWPQFPVGSGVPDVADVAVDADDRAYLLIRTRPPGGHVLVFERTGSFVGAWGDGALGNRPHAITIAPNGTVYVVDEPGHCIRKFTTSGAPLGVIGTPGQPSQTDFDAALTDPVERAKSLRGAAPPFNRPTKVAVAEDGDLFVSDGYGNAAVHHFGRDERLIATWGGGGSEPGLFRTPHYVAITRTNDLLVCDRENGRIQVFTLNGELRRVVDLQRPSAAAVGPDGSIYVAEMGWKPGEHHFVQGPLEASFEARVSVLDADATPRDTWGASVGEPCMPGNFLLPHGIAVDSRGDVYVAELTWSTAMGARLANGELSAADLAGFSDTDRSTVTARARQGMRVPASGCHPVQKFSAAAG